MVVVVVVVTSSVPLFGTFAPCRHHFHHFAVVVTSFGPSWPSSVAETCHSYPLEVVELVAVVGSMDSA